MASQGNNEEKTENKKGNCKVCLNAFNGTNRRPRMIPCGHTFCTKCVSDYHKLQILLCPLCRREHQAASPTDFPINYELEEYIPDGASHDAMPPEVHSPESAPPQPISKMLKSIRTDLSSKTQILKSNSREVSSQLQHCKTLMKEWEEHHLKSSETFLAISRQHEDIARSIRKESVRLSEAITEEEEERMKMEMAVMKLQEAKSNQEVLPAIEETTLCFDALDLWTQEALTNFPNADLISKAQILQEKGQTLLNTLAAFEEMAAAAEEARTLEAEISNQSQEAEALIQSHEAEASLPHEMNILAHSNKGNESSLETSSTPMASVEEKLNKALEATSSFKQISEPKKDVHNQEVQTELEGNPFVITVHNLQHMTPLVQERIESGQVLAVKEIEGRLYYANISIQQNKLYLHVLTENIPPHDATILQHSDVMSLVSSSSRRTFLEFSSEEETLGRVIIKLEPQSLRAENFAALCTGQMGPSYLNTKILQKSWKGKKAECVVCGGKEVVPGVAEELEGCIETLSFEGSVFACDESDAKASQFAIVIRRNTRYFAASTFANVETGFGVIREVSRYPNTTDVKISDCGIILPI